MDRRHRLSRDFLLKGDSLHSLQNSVFTPLAHLRFRLGKRLFTSIGGTIQARCAA
jgi:hypothetical protein